MRIKISSDSTCDLSPAFLDRYEIETAPLTILMDQAAFRDGIDITPAQVIDHVDAGGELCSTTAVNIQDYLDLFSRLSAQYDAVIHITIGSGFSSCYQNARTAALEFSNVHVVDSANLSAGQGLLVVLAAKLARQGLDAPAICQALEEAKSRSECSFLLNRLDYMRKGGRCSSVAALGANLLHLRPCIEVVDGAMQVVKKYRGSPEKCFSTYIQERLSDRALDHSLLIVTWTEGTSEEIQQAVRQAVEQYGGDFEEISYTVANCTVTCHCGPNTAGVLFFRADSDRQ